MTPTVADEPRRTLSLSNLFPAVIDNNYRGAPLAKWVFVVVTLVTIGRSLAHIFLPDGGAQSIATVPLDGFTTGGADAVIHIFAQWGLAQLLFGLFYAIVLWRYRALIPLMYLFILVEYAGRLLLSMAKPMETTGTAPGAVGNCVLIPLALLMLLLALRQRV